MRISALGSAGLALAVAAAGCGGHAATPPVPAGYAMAPSLNGFGLAGRFKHVVVIVQENRTPDNLFNGFPGADTVRRGLNSKNQYVPLRPIQLGAKYGADHSHTAYVVEYNGGKMNGFDEVQVACKGPCPPETVRMYGIVPLKQSKPYWVMASRYAFADRMFQTNQGPSFPAHQYIISGTSTPVKNSVLRVAENPNGRMTSSMGGCDSAPGSLVALIDPQGRENTHKPIFPCFERPTIFDLVAAKGLTWKYYQNNPGSGLWNAPDAIRHLRYGPAYNQHVITPPSQVLLDAAGGNLADLTIVTPTPDDSDHANITDKSGPSWVAQIVNAVGKSRYWNDTAIVVTWDDWGGWYDHVSPPQYNSYELGFRVPLIVISRYTPKGYVSHNQHEFGSILKFVEQNFNLGSLGTTDVRSDNLADCFDFTKPPRGFVPIPAPGPMSQFLNERPAPGPPDDD
jgi:phospholipase C